MNLLGIIICLIGVINVVLGLLVFLKNPKRSNNITYFFVTIAISIWVFVTYFYNNPFLFNTTTWLEIVYIASYLMLFTQMLFVYFFPRKISDNFMIYAIVIILTLLPSIFVLFLKDTVILSTTHLPSEYRTIAEMGSGYIIYTIPNVLGIVLLSIYFLRKGKKFVGYEKVQVNLYVLGSLLMMGPIVAMDYLIPLLTGNTDLYVYGPLFVLPFSILVAYSILQNRFLDQKAMIGVVISYILKSLFFIPILFIVVNYNLVSSTTVLKLPFLIVWFIALSFILFIYSWYAKNIDIFVQKVVLKQRLSASEIINDFSKKNSTELNLNQVCINVRQALFDSMRINKLGIIFLDSSNRNISFKYLYHLNIEGARDFIEILHYWNKVGNTEPLIADEVKRKIVFGDKHLDRKMGRIIDFMDKYRVSAILPLDQNSQLNGILLIGYKPQELPFTIKEVEFLEHLVATTSVAVGRALLYKQVEDFNLVLKQKVNIQTKELQQKVSELEEARRKETDMIDIMGHELRTPATIVKLNAQLLEQVIQKKDIKSLKKYIDRIKDGVEREIKLINTLLSSAKLEGDKIEISPEEIDITKEIEMALHAHEKQAKDKKIKLINNIPKNLSTIFSDHARTVEVINNLISNAVKYTEKGSVTVEADELGDMVHIDVIDTGYGIPKKDIPNLGKKFFRVQTYIEAENSDDIDIVRPGGTGLGLYVVFSLVEKMGGSVHVTSEVGKGSVFSISLPKYTGQKSGVIETKSNDMFEKLGLKRNTVQD